MKTGAMNDKAQGDACEYHMDKAVPRASLKIRLLAISTTGLTAMAPVSVDITQE